MKVKIKLLVSSPNKIPQALRFLERIDSSWGDRFEIEGEIEQTVTDKSAFTDRRNFIPVYPEMERKEDQ